MLKRNLEITLKHGGGCVLSGDDDLCRALNQRGRVIVIKSGPILWDELMTIRQRDWLAIDNRLIMCAPVSMSTSVLDNFHDQPERQRQESN